MRQYFKQGTTVLFQGDSVTDCGRTENGGMGAGYPIKVSEIYNTLFPACEVKFINRAVSGNRVCDLLARYDKDFLQIKPDFLSILIGVNNTWRRYDSGLVSTKECFEKEYRELLTKIKKDMPNTKVMLITPFLLDTDPAKCGWHGDLDEKTEIIKQLSAEFGCMLFDYSKILQNIADSKQYSLAELSADGVHPTDLGQSLLAVEYLKFLEII